MWAIGWGARTRTIFKGIAHGPSGDATAHENASVTATTDHDYDDDHDDDFQRELRDGL
jgi:hypothetical protein